MWLNSFLFIGKICLCLDGMMVVFGDRLVMLLSGVSSVVCCEKLIIFVSSVGWFGVCSL